MATRYNNRKSTQLINQLTALGIANTELLSVLADLPREQFVADALTHKAYQNTALPIGHGQTISQPYIVAKMTQALLSLPNKPKKILEIGTGCGYQTAVLARLFEHVYTVERIKSLQFSAKRKLHSLDIHNVSMTHADGWNGWPSKGPFDAIIVTAAADGLPEALCQQLHEHGNLIIPIGVDEQCLYQITKTNRGFTQKALEKVKFVPLIQGEII